MRRLAGLLLILILAGCGTPPKSSIVGTWLSHHGFMITYTADGVAYFEGASNLGCYTITGDTLRIVNKTPSSDVTITENTVTFDGELMVFSGPDGSIEHRRVDKTGTLSDKGLQATLDPEIADPQTQRCPKP